MPDSTQSRRPRRRFPKISPSAFQHPMDLKALEAVKKAKGIDLLIRKMSEFYYERVYYINNIADSVKITPLQVPLVHNMLVEACEILDVPLPELYIDQNPIVNAYTFGTEKPFIVLQSGLIDLLSDDELFGVIAHEVGHIKCGHVLYKMVGEFLRAIIKVIDRMTFGFGELISTPLLVAFYEWDRKAELSSDRASLLATQDANVVINTLMKLAGGSSKVVEQMDREQFLLQAESYRELDSSVLNQFYKLMQVLWRSHPFPALRAKEINQWSQSMEYQNILDGIYTREGVEFYGNNYDFGSGYQRPNSPPSGYPPSGYPPNSPVHSPGGAVISTCPNCDAAVEANATFCHMCGSTIIGAIAVLDKSSGPYTPPSPPAAPPSSGPTPPTPKPEPPKPEPKRDNTPRCRNCGTVIKNSDDYCPSCGLNTRFDW